VKRAIGLSALGILLLALVFGCSFGMTLEERIQQFQSDLNLAVRTDIYLNFHSTDTVDYPAIRDSDYISISFALTDPGDPTTVYVISIVDQTDPLAVTATISSTAMGAGSPYDAIFKMALEGLDYKIVTLGVDWNDDSSYEVVIQ